MHCILLKTKKTQLGLKNNNVYITMITYLTFYVSHLAFVFTKTVSWKINIYIFQYIISNIALIFKHVR